MYATLSMAYEAIVRIRQRLPLFEEVCRVLVERGQLRMVWVGEVDDHGSIIPIAHAGVTDGYLDGLRISVRDVPEGRGPTGTAARERKHMIVTDIATDERMAPWREAALARGYRSTAAFPLVLDDRCVAVLTAYASEPGFFDEQQVELFDRMAADLSFASEAIEREERRRAAEAKLRSSEERFRAAEVERRSSEERFRATARRCLTRSRSSHRFAIRAARSSIFAMNTSMTPIARWLALTVRSCSAIVSGSYSRSSRAVTGSRSTGGWPRPASPAGPRPCTARPRGPGRYSPPG